MKAYIITGGNSGLGYETARRILREDRRVILACRNLEKGKAAVRTLREESGCNTVEARELDLASFASIHCFVNQLEGCPVDALDNNAGIAGMQQGTTADGFDIVFQTNHLGHFLLTNLLLPQMKDHGRIMNISSDMHNPPYFDLRWKGVESLAHPQGEMKERRYFYSKLCNLYFSYELQRRLQEAGRLITVLAFNPGFMGATNLAGGSMTQERIDEVKRTMPDRYGELPTSAQAAADLLTEDCYLCQEAKYYDRSTKAAPSSPLSYSLANAKELWEQSASMVGLSQE